MHSTQLLSTVIFHSQNSNSAGETECQRVGTTTATVFYEKQSTLVLPVPVLASSVFKLQYFSLYKLEGYRPRKGVSHSQRDI